MEEEIKDGKPAQNAKRYEKLGFKPQKELSINKYLPYADKIDEESAKMFEEIKVNWARCVAMREINPGAGILACKLLGYIKLYDLKFSKEDHLNFVRLMLELIAIPDLEPSKINKFCVVLSKLLRKSEWLSPDDLQVDWRPLYNLSKLILDKNCSKGDLYRFFPKKNTGNDAWQAGLVAQLSAHFGVAVYETDDDESNLVPNLQFVINQCSLYFPKSSTQEILNEFLPRLQPLDTGKGCVIFELLSIFLNPREGYELWFTDFMNLWDTYHNPPWSADMMNIMARLASQTIGEIDWEPYMATIFARILRCIDLPVCYKQMKSSKNQGLWSADVACWIVSMLGPKTSGQKYLSNFMVTIESYLHPANVGKWVAQLSELLMALNKQFFDRLKSERYRVHPWKVPIPEDHKLTEDCITAFVECIKPVAFQAMYSRIVPNDACKVFKYLADLRPHLVIPGIIDRVYTTLDSLTEPHKLTAALQCLMFVGRALVAGHMGYTEGKTRLIPILFATLPGIDSNDFKKTSTVLQFLTSVSLLIPLVDCSKAGQYYDDLTEEELLLCEQTADLEDFVLQFMDRIFTIVESSAVENTRLELAADEGLRSKLDAISEALIQSCCHAILGQCSQEIKTSASRKLIDFVKTHILEPRVAGQLVGSLVRVFARINGRDLLKSLVPYLTTQINVYISEGQAEGIADLDKQNDELLYYLTLLSNLLRSDPNEVMDYIEPDIIPIIDKILVFKCKTTNRTACGMINNIMANMSSLLTVDVQSAPDCFRKPLSECLPIRCWGQKMKPNTPIDWFVPDERSRRICEMVIHHYLPGILTCFEQVVSGEKVMTREEINRDLQVIVSLLRCGNYLPNWNEPPLMLVDTVINQSGTTIALGFEGLEIHMPDSSNVRLAVIECMARLQEKLLATSEDDTNSLKTLLLVWERVHMRKHQNSPFETQLKNYQTTKQFQEYTLTRYKRDIRAVVATRVVMQQDCRDEQLTPLFTASHRTVMLNILKLSTSHYSSVRSVAQSKLNVMFSQYPFAYKTILDDVLAYLKLDSNECHEQFKGALYILASKKATRMIVKHDWETVEKVWIQLLQTNMSEKPTVLRLLQILSDAIHNEFPTLTIELAIPDGVVEHALALLPPKQRESVVSAADIEVGRQALLQRNRKNRELYVNIVTKILDILKTKTLHWRYSNLAASMIYNMVHPVTHYPPSVAAHFVKNLVHETLKERKIAIKIVNMVLRQNKREHVKVTMDPFKIAGVERPPGDHGALKLKPGMRPDNRWLQYDVATVPTSQEEWDRPVYMYKQNGFFGWTQDFSVYAPTAQQPNLDRDVSELSEIERSIYDFFADRANVDKLMEYWALEEKKGKDKFNRTRFNLIKNLCDTFGDAFLDNLMAQLGRLIEEKSLENNHRAAAEVMGGIMKGAKHWSYEKTCLMYAKMTPLIHMALANVTVETDIFWGTCFATAAEHNDPMRMHWLHEVLLQEPMRDTTSFIDCSRLYCLQGAFNQHVWRMNSVAWRLLEIVRPYLNHSFQNVRERLGSILTNIFEADLQFADASPPECPRIKDFIAESMPQMEVLLRDSPPTVKPVDAMEVDGEEVKDPEGNEYEKAVRLFKTIGQWLIGVLNRCTNGNEPAYFQLLPIACRLERSEQDAELADVCSSLLAMISQALTLPSCMNVALCKIDEVSKMSSWSARLAVIDVLQVMVFHNMAIVLSRQDWIRLVQDIVLRLMEDPVLEVREKAAEVLGGLLHCEFLPATETLLELFKKKCRTKVLKAAAKRLQMMESCSAEAIESREANSVRTRHTGVLGLCAFISAYPYDVPDFVPDVFEHLGAHLNDPQPIPSTIRKTMGDFKRTHHDNWQTHQLKFTENQLAVLSDLTVPPSYYA